MFVITADQIGSTGSPDAVPHALDLLTTRFGDDLLLPPDRAAGDEIQAITERADTALAMLLALVREERWSVGLGVGPVVTPLGSTVRESTGAAFVAARRAVDRAKRRPTRASVATEPASTPAEDAEALVDLLLLLRARRTPEGWELHDILQSGYTQAEAAERLGITPQAVSDRARSSALRQDAAATEALGRLLARLEEP